MLVGGIVDFEIEFDVEYDVFFDDGDLNVLLV